MSLGPNADQLASDLLKRTRDEVVFADNKASILLAGVLAAVGGVSAALGAANWNPTHQHWFVATAFWISVMTTIAGVVTLAAAIYPRGPIRRGRSAGIIAYFGDVVALKSPTDLVQALTNERDVQLTDVWIDQVWRMSAIVARKYWLLQWSMRCLAVALSFAVIAVAEALASAE